MIYRLFGYWVRRDALRLAAQAFRVGDAVEGYAPRLWSLAVFFENYLCTGADGTMEDFGPKEPEPLKAVKP